MMTYCLVNSLAATWSHVIGSVAITCYRQLVARHLRMESFEFSSGSNERLTDATATLTHMCSHIKTKEILHVNDNSEFIRIV